MATYTYRCAIDGPVDVRRPIGTAPVTVPCPACGATSYPGDHRAHARPRRPGPDGVLDRTAASRFEPDVVSSIPTGPRGARAAAGPADQQAAAPLNPL